MSQQDVVIAVAGAGTGIATAGQGISMLSASGQAIAGIVSAVAPIGGAIAINPAAGLITFIKIGIDASNGQVNVGDVVSVVGNSVTVAAAVCAVVPGGQPLALGLAVVGRAMAIAGIGLSLLDVNYPLVGPGISFGVSDGFSSARRPPPRDPLAIDLDGDGIETLGIPTNGTSPILFDHNADGVRTGTGWLRPDDAWLVLDRNGNGTIDSGRELFGVDTVITRTITSPSGTYSFETTAATGFEALRALDANGDRVLNAADAAFTQVRLWQDTNQNGVSDAGELATLAERGITGIGLTETAATTNLGNGNTVTGTATVTRSNGSRNLRPKRRRATHSPTHFGIFVPLMWMRERGSLRGLAQRGSCLF